MGDLPQEVNLYDMCEKENCLTAHTLEGKTRGDKRMFIPAFMHYNQPMETRNLNQRRAMGKSALPAFVLAAFVLPALLLPGCKSKPDAGDGIVGSITAIPFGIFSTDRPQPGEPSFFNEKFGHYEVIRPLDDLATILFFASQEQADAYVRMRFRSDRRPEVPLLDSWPPTLSGRDFDVFSERDLGQVLKEELAVIKTQVLRHPEWGDTGHPAFRSQATGRETPYLVYIREGYIRQSRRLDVRSANLHFHSIWYQAGTS